MRVEIALFEVPDAPGMPGPTLLGRVTDADLIAAVRARLAAHHRRELARLQGRPLRVVADPDEDGAA